MFLVARFVGLKDSDTCTNEDTHHREESMCQWSFLVPLIGGRYHIIPQLAVYTTYIPETAIECVCSFLFQKAVLHVPSMASLSVSVADLFD